MTGKIKGVKSRLLKQNPNALFVHFVCHNLNLVLHDAAQNVVILRDALQIVHEIGKFIRESANRISILKEVALDELWDTSVPEPMCQTR